MAKPLPISAERWQRLKRLYQDAIDRPALERPRFLEDACGDDLALKAEVESLLAASESAEGFLEQPAVDLGPPDPAAELRPSCVGAYKLLKKIGGGEMGTVYLAVRDDDESKRRVAIKLLRTGIETRDLLSFRRERQILAALDHENIASLLDSGTTEDGRLYLVMEYVEGQPIDQFSDARRLSVRERLALFRTVSSAVDFAHQNLVVHGDLKPANVLVSAAGVPKLLDLGIARLLNPELAPDAIDPRRFELRMITPDYASPEQVRGGPITTASDVYSLGVLLYELLTGHRPYRFTTRSLQAITEVICEQEPTRPSTVIDRVEEALTLESVSRTREGRPEKLRRKLSGDLDDIVLMALRKEPQRRYRSVAEFSDDIERYLDGRPVRARPDTFRYRTGKFVRRHRRTVAAATLLISSLLAGLVATLVEWQRAEAQRARAERRFNEVRELANSLLFEVHDAVANLPGGAPLRQLLVQRGLEHLERLARESADDPSLRRELAEAYRKVGDIQGNPRNPNLGDAKRALESYRAAETLVKGLPSTDAAAKRSLSLIYRGMADVLGESGSTEEARTAYGEAVEAAAAALALASDDPEAVRLVYEGQIRLGDLMIRTGEHTDETLATYESALRLHESVVGHSPPATRDKLDRAVLQERLADVEAMRGNYPKAVQGYTAALAIHESILSADPHFAPALRARALMNEKAATALAKAGATPRALESYRQATALQESLLAAEPQNVQLRADVARVLALQANLEADAGRLIEARRLTARALSLSKANADREGASAFDLNTYADALLACRPEEMRQPRVALQYAARGVEMTGWTNASLLGTLALAHFQSGDVTRAVELQEKALALLPEKATNLRQAGEKALAEFKAKVIRN